MCQTSINYVSSNDFSVRHVLVSESNTISTYMLHSITLILLNYLCLRVSASVVFDVYVNDPLSANRSSRNIILNYWYNIFVLQMLVKKVDALTKAMEVERRKMTREVAAREKEISCIKSPDDNMKNRNTNSSKRFYNIFSITNLFHFSLQTICHNSVVQLL